VADEVSMIGVRQQLDLLRVARAHGARVVQIGDPRQCGSIETPALNLMCKAISDEQIPKLLTSIRQKTARGREIATMFREGRAEEGIAEMRRDGDVALVAGGSDATIQRTVASWRRRMEANAADPDYALIVMTPTNDRVLDIGKAIREDRRRAGEIGPEDVIVRAKIGPTADQVIDLPLAVGDRIRPFHRLFDADASGRSKYLASNGDIVEIRELLADGLRIRNADGQEGRITWSQLKPFRAPKNDPVTLTYGYTSSIDSAQSLTRSEAILSLPDGSQRMSGNKAYTALSRHVRSVERIVSDAAERRQITQRQMLGLAETPREADVIRNIAANLSRFSKRRLATEMRRHESAWTAAEQPAREAARQRHETPTADGLMTAIAHSPIKLLTGPDQVRRDQQTKRNASERPKRAKPRHQPTQADAVAAFADALRRSGVRLRTEPVMDGSGTGWRWKGTRDARCQGAIVDISTAGLRASSKTSRLAWRKHGGRPSTRGRGIVLCRR
jgi:hypothetical protein